MIRKNIFFNIILSLSQVLFPLITFPYASRILGPAGVGSVSYIDSYTQLIILISSIGIPIYGVREISKVKGNKEELNKVFSELLIIHFCVSLIFIALYCLFFLTISKTMNYQSLIFSGTLIIFFNVFTMEWFFQGLEEFAYVTKRTVLVRSIFVLVMFLLIRSNEDYNIYYFLIAITYILSGLINLAHSFTRVQLIFRNINIKRHMPPLLVVMGSSIAISVYLLLDNAILGYIKGPIPVGYYSTSVRIIKITLSIITATGIVLIPQLSTAFSEHNYERVNELINKSFNYVCSFGIPVVMVIIISAPSIINILVGQKFIESITILQMLSVLVFIIGLTNIFAWQILTPMGKDKTILAIVSCGVIISITLNFVLIPLWAHLGAAVANLITEAFIMLSSLFFVLKIKLIKISIYPLLYSLMGSAIFYPIFKLLSAFTVFNNLVTACISISISTILYLIFQLYIVKNRLMISFAEMIFSKLCNK